MGVHKMETYPVFLGGLSPSQRVETKQNNKGPDAVSNLWSNKSE